MLNALYEALSQHDHCTRLLLHTYRSAKQGKEADIQGGLHTAIVAFSEDVDVELTASLNAIACSMLLCAEELIWKKDPTEAPQGMGLATPWYDRTNFDSAVETVNKACEVSHQTMHKQLWPDTGLLSALIEGTIALLREP